MEFIVGILSADKDYWEKPFLIVIKINEEYFLYCHSSIYTDDIQSDLFPAGILEFSNVENVRRSANHPFLNNSCIYYSNQFDGELKPFQNPNNGNFIDLSTNWLLHFRMEIPPLVNNSRIINYTTFEDSSQIQFLISQRNRFFDIRLPDYVEITMVSGYNMEFIINYLQANGGLDESDQVVLEVIEKRLNENERINEYELVIFYALVYENLKMYIPESTIGALKNLEEILLSTGEVEFLDIVDQLPFVEGKIDGINDLITLINSELHTYKQESRTAFLISTDNLVLIRRFISNYNKIQFRFVEAVYYRWKFQDSSVFGGLSSGEKAKLKLFSRLQSGSMFFTFLVSGGIIILDEAEIGYHPEWQRLYLNELLNYINTIHSSIINAERVQLIITSHSPFLVSDVLKEDILFLNSGEDGYCTIMDNQFRERTFAANIHTLYSDSFFLEKALIGEFAINKIQPVINWLNDPEAEMTEEILIEKEWIINKIGEPILRGKLEEMYQFKVSNLR